MDIERLLGSLVGSGLRRKSSDGGMLRKAAFSREGITLLAGIGIAAYEHYRSRHSPGPKAPMPPLPGPGAAHGAPPGYSTPPVHNAPAHGAPPVFGAGATPQAPPLPPAAPPPFPGAAAGIPAAPVPPLPGLPWGGRPLAPPPPPEPELLLRAMVLAALADGVLDGDERAALARYLERDGVTPAEQAHLGRLLADPGSIDDLAALVTDPGTAAEVWAAARLAIDPDTAAEQAFLADLADRLGLDSDALAEIEARLEEAGAG
ncbi:MAG: hypothetical protein RLY86_2536 [Pseudomonadota bacterium]|jgi:uncharacterized membrane protein YebE (DUF533 family)